MFLRGPGKQRPSLAVRCAAGWLLVGFCCLMVGCGGQPTVGTVSEAEQQALIAAAKAPPRLEAGEKIRVTVFGESALTGDYQIDPSGLLSLPLAGTVKAAGLTQAEMAAELTKHF